MLVFRGVTRKCCRLSLLAVGLTCDDSTRLKVLEAMSESSERIDGDRHSQKGGWSVRGFDKPIHGSGDRHRSFPGGIPSWEPTYPPKMAF